MKKDDLLNLELNTKFTHPFLRYALHIPLIADPCGTPASEIDTKREKKYIFYRLSETQKFDGCILGFFIVNPIKAERYKSCQSDLSFFQTSSLFKLQYTTWFKCPFQRMFFRLFIMHYRILTVENECRIYNPGFVVLQKENIRSSVTTCA